MNFGLRILSASRHRGLALLAHTGANDNGSGSSITTPSVNTTGASLLIAIVSVYPNGGTFTFSDNKSNTWTTLIQCTGGLGLPTILYSSGSNLTSVGTNHTVTAHDDTSSGTAVVFMAFSGTEAITDPTDAGTISQQFSPNSMTATAGAISAPNTGDLVIAGMGCYAGFAPATSVSIDSGLTIPDTLAAAGSGPAITLWGAWSVSDGSIIDPTWTLGTMKSPGADISAFAHA